MSYKGILERDLTVPPMEVMLLAAFFAVSTGVSLLVLLYVLANTLRQGFWPIAAVTSAGICVAVGLLYLGMTHTLAAHR